MSFDVKASQDFLNFIQIKNEKGQFSNLKMLIDLEKNNPGIFIKVMKDFDRVKSFRESLDKEGKPIKISWEDTLKNFYSSDKYKNVSKENLDIAELFGERGLSQKTFDKVSKLRESMKKKKIANHILGKEIREETILESIEQIKNRTNNELKIGKQLIEELYDKKFTYEWLSKNDPRNSIIGLFCDCCGTITSQFYGQKIAQASMIAEDVQNLIVKDSKDNIISKGTMYINKDKGYAVINDFELNGRYRKHQGRAGRYNVKETSREEEERDLIFKAFQRGLQAFIKEYDKQNPDNPLNQINIGMGYNRLKRQVEQFEKATANLDVPEEYSFKDAMEHEQYILYKREEKNIDKAELDR